VRSDDSYPDNCFRSSTVVIKVKNAVLELFSVGVIR
jgi:hypothetical protein